MAKEQNLSLNPTKISGVCGRLMCCLKYENHMYCKHGCNGCGRRERIEIPKMGSKVVTTMGEGKVVGINRKERTAAVQLSPDNTIQQDAKEFCYTTDAVFLGNFPHVVRKAKVLELGCGTGAISMLLESRGAAEVTALDCNPQVTKLVRQSVADNSLQDKFTVIDGDLRNYLDAGGFFPGGGLCCALSRTLCFGAAAGALCRKHAAGAEVWSAAEAFAMGAFQN